MTQKKGLGHHLTTFDARTQRKIIAEQMER
jgi:hypothetical protein